MLVYMNVDVKQSFVKKYYSMNLWNIECDMLYRTGLFCHILEKNKGDVPCLF